MKSKATVKFLACLAIAALTIAGTSSLQLNPWLETYLNILLLEGTVAGVYFLMPWLSSRFQDLD
ncbi:hypothetical protein Pse7367_0165 [Thalassoporum mexicanum PCC 7367]|uniref:hypothetical protein n=1 Tax=Thalassoporum mexicanum TaxID=3457544 RepID=UPI00029F827A|nr:hypothetical protein [Pseudanabaena sp. PCC 7367]AFY68482.1 hypothetical protein Pse7367_0165 [Pseudanabaena sp. PCC 7367]